MRSEENEERLEHLQHMLQFWIKRRDFADRKGWTKIHAFADKQVRIAKKRIRRFEPKELNIPIQLIVNVEQIRSKIDSYNPYPAIQRNGK